MNMSVVGCHKAVLYPEAISIAELVVLTDEVGQCYIG